MKPEKGLIKVFIIETKSVLLSKLPRTVYLEVLTRIRGIKSFAIILIK